MKILYAASKRKNAAAQLNRFLKAVESLGHTVKIAAYRDVQCVKFVDWNLDALLNMFEPDKISFENDNFDTYYEQVKYFQPDLIISDLEVFTSYIAVVLNIPIFQVSSKLLYEGLENKYNFGLHKNYSYIFRKEYNQRIKNILDNANRNFVYSHLCDLPEPPSLKNNFEYVRPYHILGKYSPPCQHNVMAVSSENNRGLMELLNNYNDAVLFTEFLDEKYPGVVLKNLSNLSEYACNLQNCQHFVNRGSIEQLADAFYNNKYSWILPDFSDHESIINAVVTEHFKLGQMLYDASNKIQAIELPMPQYDTNTKFLHERLNEF